MKNDKLSAVRKLASESVRQLNEDEKAAVQVWAERSLVIVNNKELSRTQKLVELRKVKTSKTVLTLMLAFARLIKAKTWTGQSWARRLGVGTLAVSAAAVGSKGAGLAAFGTAQGLPLAFVTTVGATFLGVLVDELKKERKK